MASRPEGFLKNSVGHGFLLVTLMRLKIGPKIVSGLNWIWNCCI